ncbi:MAG: phosphoribosylformylglycinamidine synthase subunit PurS [Aquificaceae bacterium]|nr:phosphoribosylformylglycinamidine synthase subunit PurS [Aquificaceae bacterium]
MKLRLYNRYSRDFWLIPVVCPDFLKRCKPELTPDGVKLEYEFFSEHFFIKLTTTGITEEEYSKDRELLYEGLRPTYLQKLDNIDPSLGISVIGLPYPPKPLWDVLYSLASLIFTLKIGRDKPNLILPEVQLISPHEDKSIVKNLKIIVELREVSREEAKKRVRQWCDKLLPKDKKEDIAKALVQEGYITKVKSFAGYN